MTYSTFGAEILAAADADADADDRGFDIKSSLESVFQNEDFKHEILVESRALFDTITTLHEPLEYCLRKVLARMRDAFESGDLYVFKWVQGCNNLADTLTMPN